MTELVVFFSTFEFLVKIRIKKLLKKLRSFKITFVHKDNTNEAFHIHHLQL